MPTGLSFSRVFGALEKAVGIAHKRHTFITGNISNLDTPGYRGRELDFRKALSRALDTGEVISLVRSNPSHLKAEAFPDAACGDYDESGEWNGINWVDIDREMAKLSENTLLYRTSLEVLMRKLAILKEVIKEGGR